MLSELDYIHKDFRNLEGLYNPEFNRDWNLEQQPTSNQIVADFGDQLLITAGTLLGILILIKLNINFSTSIFQRSLMAIVMF